MATSSNDVTSGRGHRSASESMANIPKIKSSALTLTMGPINETDGGHSPPDRVTPTHVGNHTSTQGPATLRRAQTHLSPALPLPALPPLPPSPGTTGYAPVSPSSSSPSLPPLPSRHSQSLSRPPPSVKAPTLGTTQSHISPTASANSPLPTSSTSPSEASSPAIAPLPSRPSLSLPAKPLPTLPPPTRPVSSSSMTPTIPTATTQPITPSPILSTPSSNETGQSPLSPASPSLLSPSSTTTPHVLSSPTSSPLPSSLSRPVQDDEALSFAHMKVAQLEREMTELKTRLSFANKILDTTETHLENAKKQLLMKENEVLSLQKQMNEMRTSSQGEKREGSDMLMNRIKEIEKERDEARREAKEQSDYAKMIAIEYEKAKAVVEQVGNDLEAKEELIHRLSERVKVLEQVKEEGGARVEKLQKRLMEDDEEISRLEEEVNNRCMQLEVTKEKLDDILETKCMLEKKLNKTEERANAAETRAREMEMMATTRSTTDDALVKANERVRIAEEKASSVSLVLVEAERKTAIQEKKLISMTNEIETLLSRAMRAEEALSKEKQMRTQLEAHLQSLKASGYTPQPMSQARRSSVLRRGNGTQSSTTTSSSMSSSSTSSSSTPSNTGTPPLTTPTLTATSVPPSPRRDDSSTSRPSTPHKSPTPLPLTEDLNGSRSSTPRTLPRVNRVSTSTVASGNNNNNNNNSGTTGGLGLGLPNQRPRRAASVLKDQHHHPIHSRLRPMANQGMGGSDAILITPPNTGFLNNDDDDDEDDDDYHNTNDDLRDSPLPPPLPDEPTPSLPGTPEIVDPLCSSTTSFDDNPDHKTQHTEHKSSPTDGGDDGSNDDDNFDDPPPPPLPPLIEGDEDPLHSILIMRHQGRQPSPSTVAAAFTRAIEIESDDDKGVVISHNPFVASVTYALPLTSSTLPSNQTSANPKPVTSTSRDTTNGSHANPVNRSNRSQTMLPRTAHDSGLPPSRSTPHFNKLNPLTSNDLHESDSDDYDVDKLKPKPLSSIRFDDPSTSSPTNTSHTPTTLTAAPHPLITTTYTGTDPSPLPLKRFTPTTRPASSSRGTSFASTSSTPSTLVLPDSSVPLTSTTTITAPNPIGDSAPPSSTSRPPSKSATSDSDQAPTLPPIPSDISRSNTPALPSTIPTAATSSSSSSSSVLHKSSLAPPFTHHRSGSEGQGVIRNASNRRSVVSSSPSPSSSSALSASSKDQVALNPDRSTSPTSSLSSIGSAPPPHTSSPPPHPNNAPYRSEHPHSQHRRLAALPTPPILSHNTKVCDTGSNGAGEPNQGDTASTDPSSHSAYNNKNDNRDLLPTTSPNHFSNCNNNNSNSPIGSSGIRSEMKNARDVAQEEKKAIVRRAIPPRRQEGDGIMIRAKPNPNAPQQTKRYKPVGLRAAEDLEFEFSDEDANDADNRTAASFVDDLTPERADRLVRDSLRRMTRAFLLSPDAGTYLQEELEEIAECTRSETAMKQAIDRLRAEYVKSTYVITSKLGSGGFGAVYKGMDFRTSEPVAIKVVNLETGDENEVTSINREISMLAQGGSCPQLIGYRGSELRGARLWIIMELVDGGSLLDLVRRVGPIDEKYIAVIAKEILLGLSHLQSEGKIHRDIKAANVLLSKKGDVKLADFGASRTLHDTLSRCNTFVGSPYWMAPEILTQNEYDGKADVWSLGITCFEMATGKPPHTHVAPLAALQLVSKSPPPSLPASFSSSFREFVSACLLKDPKQRSSAMELLKSKFIKNAKKKTILQDFFKDY